MKDLYNRFVFTHWKHNEGHEDRWLRRINRQTKTQYISDCQRYLITGDGKYMKGIFQRCATRFYISVKGVLSQYRGRLANPDGVNSVTLVEDFSILDAPITFDELKAYCTTLERVYIRPIKEGDYDEKIATHLKDIFGDDMNVHVLMDTIGYMNTTHETNPIANSATHYHITTQAENKKVVHSNECQGNGTITFWKFGKDIVFKRESGIGTW